MVLEIRIAKLTRKTCSHVPVARRDGIARSAVAAAQIPESVNRQKATRQGRRSTLRLEVVSIRIRRAVASTRTAQDIIFGARERFQRLFETVETHYDRLRATGRHYKVRLRTCERLAGNSFLGNKRRAIRSCLIHDRSFPLR